MPAPASGVVSYCMHRHLQHATRDRCCHTTGCATRTLLRGRGCYGGNSHVAVAGGREFEALRDTAGAYICIARREGWWAPR